MTIYLALLIALVGAIIYLLCGNPPNPSSTSPKVAELGRVMFFCGLLAFLLQAGGLRSINLVH